MRVYSTEAIDCEELIEVADSESVIVATIQNGSTIDTTDTSISEHSAS